MIEPTPDEAADRLSAYADLQPGSVAWDPPDHAMSRIWPAWPPGESGLSVAAFAADLRVLLAERAQLRRDLAKARADSESWQSVAADREGEITRLRAQCDEIAGCLPIEELELDRRAYNILKAAGICHISEITRRTEDELYQLRNMGKISMCNLKDRLRDGFGLTLRQERTP